MTLGSRAWWAWHCLHRQPDGEPPQLKKFEEKHEIPNGTMARVFSGERKSPRHDTLKKMAQALKVSTGFLLEGTGNWPNPTGPVPQRKITHDGQTQLPTPVFETVQPPGGTHDLGWRTAAQAATEPTAHDELAPLRRHAVALLQLPPFDYPELKAKEMVQSVLGFKHDTPLEAEEVAKLADHVERMVVGLPPRGRQELEAAPRGRRR